MGNLIDRKIDTIRTYVDPNAEHDVPDWDYHEIMPITEYQAVHRTSDPQSTTLSSDLDAIKSSISNKQDKITAGEAGTLASYTGMEGEFGSVPVVKEINPDDTAQSYNKVTSERAVGKALETKANKGDFDSHATDERIHVTQEDKDKWDHNAEIGQYVDEHIADTNIHVTAADKENWDEKADGEAFESHVSSSQNPHNVTAHQVGSYTVEEIDAMFQSIRESFFTYKNIHYDETTGEASLVPYDEAEWSPNYVLSYGDPLPNPVDTSLIYFALKPVTDYSVNESNEVIIYRREGTEAWREVGLSEMEMGDVVIRYPDSAMFTWLSGRFVNLFNEGGGSGGGSSDLLWRPSVDSEGILTFVKSSETLPPDPVNIKGPAGYTPQKGIDYNDGANGVGVPEGGEDGMFIVKYSGADYDTQWMTFAQFLDTYVDPEDLPDLIADYSNIRNTPTIYTTVDTEHVGDDVSLISQKALNTKFKSTDQSIEDLQNAIGGSGGEAGISKRLNDHLLDFQNPHRVTATQIGAVSNTLFLQHTSDRQNPHNVTAEQLGLGEVNNTSDANKPISLAQKQKFDEVDAAIQAINDALGGSDMVTQIDWDPMSLTLTLYKASGEVVEIIFPIESVMDTMNWDEENHALQFTMPDGTVKSVTINNMVTVYRGGQTDTINVDVDNTTGEITADIRPKSIDGTMVADDIDLSGSPTTTTQNINDKTNKLATTEFVKNQVVNDFESYVTDRPASANLARILNAEKTSIQDVVNIIEETPMCNVVDNLTSTDAYAALSANMGRYLNINKAPLIHTASSGSIFGRASVNLFGHARAANIDPLMDGETEIGTDDGFFARADHRHPTDTSRAPMNWGEGSGLKMTGEVRAETPPDNSNDDRVATTEWVMNSGLVPSKALIRSHMEDHDNPHQVTASQIGAATTASVDALNNRVSALENSGGFKPFTFEIDENGDLIMIIDDDEGGEV